MKSARQTGRGLRLANCLVIMRVLGCLADVRAQSPPAVVEGRIQSGNENPTGGRLGQLETPPGKDQGKHSDSKSELISAVVGAVVGAIVGGIIGWRGSISAVNATEALARERETDQAMNLREMLRSEMEYNLQAIQDDLAWRNDQPEDFLPSQWIAHHPCPSWSSVVWANSVALLAKALKREEVLSVHKFYASLSSLTAARQALTAAWRQSKKPHIDSTSAFDEVLRLEGELLSAKNPLQPA